MVENLILSLFCAALCLDFMNSLAVVLRVEIAELRVLNYAILVSVDLHKQIANLFSLQRQVKVP
jgi:hypothetical protein